MLILGRRIGQAIVIGDGIKVRVLRATENRVHLGVEAPKEVAVHREEIYERIKRGGQKTRGRE